MAATKPVPPNVLGLIRIALLSGVLLFGVVIMYLQSTGSFEAGPSPLAAPLFTWVFFGLCAAACAAMMVLRGVVERTAPGGRSGIVIAAWAVGEGVAILGGVHWLLTGGPLLYIIGLAVFVVGLVTVSAA